MYYCSRLMNVCNVKFHNSLEKWLKRKCYQHRIINFAIESWLNTVKRSHVKVDVIKLVHKFQGLQLQRCSKRYFIEVKLQVGRIFIPWDGYQCMECLMESIVLANQCDEVQTSIRYKHQGQECLFVPPFFFGRVLVGNLEFFRIFCSLKWTHVESNDIAEEQSCLAIWYENTCICPHC